MLAIDVSVPLTPTTVRFAELPESGAHLPADNIPADPAHTPTADALLIEPDEEDYLPSQSPVPPTQSTKPIRTPTPPTPEPESATDVARAIESEVMRLTNQERTQQGLIALHTSTLLQTIAYRHSADMVSRNFFAHDNPDGCSSSCRATEGGYTWRLIGENIYMSSGYDIDINTLARMVVDGWLSSPGHRENMLKDGYTETGVGVVIVDDSMYVTALYGNPL